MLWNRLQRTLIGSTCAVLAALGTTSALANETYDDSEVSPYLITVGDPEDPTYANAGANLRNGVGSIFIEFIDAANQTSGFICTASAIGPRTVLTAAHCVRNGDQTLFRLRFVLNAGQAAPTIIEATGFAVHPLYDATEPFFGAFAPGDIAVVELAQDIPAGTETYALYRDADEFGLETRHYGHGRSGKGNKGATGGADFFYARTGLNSYEQTLAPFFGPAFEPFHLLHDFDSGGSKHNAMEWWFTSSFACHPENPDNPPQAQDGQCTTFKDGSYPDFKGFRKVEVGIAPGDSGGPGFIDGKIAGVHSFGFTHNCAGVTNGTDFTCGLDSSYGEMSGDTRVSTLAPWVDFITASSGYTPIPEPVTGGGTGSNGTSLDVPELTLRGDSFRSSVLSATMRASVTAPQRD